MPNLVVTPEPAPNRLVVTNETSTLTVQSPITRYVKVIAEGPQGPRGEQGVSGDAYFVHIQSAPLALWTITHDLEKAYPSVTVINSSNDIIYGDVEYVNATTITVAFSGGFSGRCVLN